MSKLINHKFASNSSIYVLKLWFCYSNSSARSKSSDSQAVSIYCSSEVILSLNVFSSACIYSTDGPFDSGSFSVLN